MSFQYIENKWAWEKQQKKIKKLLDKPYDTLSIHEKLDLVYDKYFKHEKITYAEYELMVLVANDEVWFCYKDSVYQIDHGLPDITAMYITEYCGKQKKAERSENYSSVKDLLDKFRINEKTIKEIWDEVTLIE